MDGPTAVRRTSAIKKSPSYVKAYEDIPFLNRDELRPVRLQLELLKPELLQVEHGVHSTIVVFGGTRIAPAEITRAKIRALERKVKARPHDNKLAAQLAVAQRLLAKAKYYDEARKFGTIVSSSCQIAGSREFVIVTGGGPGIMEAANRGAFDVGAKSIGLNITLPHEPEPNSYITPELCFQFRYFAIRKMHFLMRAKALVIFPGGYGTMDELFEALTLVQTKKVPPLPIVLVSRDYWQKALNIQFFVEEGVIDPADAELIHYVESAEEAWEYIQQFHRKMAKCQDVELRITAGNHLVGHAQ
jgi:uncharacterized protein (TIGR00730 family)